MKSVAESCRGQQEERQYRQDWLSPAHLELVDGAEALSISQATLFVGDGVGHGKVAAGCRVIDASGWAC
jgi:hypothetical protein